VFVYGARGEGGKKFWQGKKEIGAQLRWARNRDVRQDEG